MEVVKPSEEATVAGPKPRSQPGTKPGGRVRTFPERLSSLSILLLVIIRNAKT
jgi:hypothetical protein